MKLKIKPLEVPRKPRTAAQVAQQRRAFYIFQLRSLWALASLLKPRRRRLVQIIIDMEIEACGAQRQGEREALRRAWFDIPEEELPF